MLRNYIEGLHKIVEEQERELAKHQEATSFQTMQAPAKGLELQLTEFFRTLSKEQLRHPWTMNEIILAGDLKGKYRDRPHPQQVAEILTRYGWTKRRLYAAEFAGKRYWFSPEGA